MRGVMKSLRSFVFLPLLALLNFAGCSGLHFPAANNSPAHLYTVTAASTAFYSHGPRQGGPDQRIPKDTLLRLVQYSPSFAKVALLEGPTGYVRTDDIAPYRGPAPAAAGWPGFTAAPQRPAEVAEVPSRVPEPPLPEFEPPPLPAQTHTN